MNPVTPEADTISGTRLLDLTTILHNSTMNASIFEPLNRNLETLLLKSRSLLREERGHEGHSRNRSRTEMSQMVTLISG